MSAPQRHRLERIPAGAAASAWAALDGVAPLTPFVRADGSGPALQQTTVRIAHDGATLFVRFDCEDRDVWGTFEQRDDPLWQEEVVEVFLAPGRADPIRYFELEVSPRGVLFDARIENPATDRARRVVDLAWDCPGIAWRAGLLSVPSGWRAELSIPWASLAPAGSIPEVWRANFYRVERPRDGDTEYSCWCPTWTEPADFHRPERFGALAF